MRHKWARFLRVAYNRIGKHVLSLLVTMCLMAFTSMSQEIGPMDVVPEQALEKAPPLQWDKAEVLEWMATVAVLPIPACTDSVFFGGRCVPISLAPVAQSFGGMNRDSVTPCVQGGW